MNEIAPLLSIESLRLEIRRGRGIDPLPILHDVSLTISPGESVGVVGESGSGKSMTTRSVMRLLPDSAHVSGRVLFDGDDVLAMSSGRLARYRASEIAMIYQDPRAHINPLWTIGDFLIEGVVAGRLMNRADARHKAIRLLAEVGISNAEDRLAQYPHQLSGGLLQRVMIVSALMSDPRLIIADEATTALDVTVQSDVMAVFRELTDERDMSVLFITHDLDLAAAVTDTIVVMYAGRIVERGSSADVYHRPLHPYTSALMQSRPDPHSQKRLVSIPGRPASAADAGEGCAFAPRCPFARDICRTELPPIRPLDGGAVACHRAEEIRDELVGAVG
jgi:oligopeptide/dipeptide ABC transporter ATP-binding protein